MISLFAYKSTLIGGNFNTVLLLNKLPHTVRVSQ